MNEISWGKHNLIIGYEFSLCDDINIVEIDSCKRSRNNMVKRANSIILERDIWMSFGKMVFELWVDHAQRWEHAKDGDKSGEIVLQEKIFRIIINRLIRNTKDG